MLNKTFLDPTALMINFSIRTAGCSQIVRCIRPTTLSKGSNSCQHIPLEPLLPLRFLGFKVGTGIGLGKSNS